MKNAHRILYKSVRKGALFCVVAATVEDERLTIHKVDFQEWDNNRRDGRDRWKYTIIFSIFQESKCDRKRFEYIQDA